MQVSLIPPWKDQPMRVAYNDYDDRAGLRGYVQFNKYTYIHTYAQAGANPAVNTPRPSRGTRIESCDFIVLIGGP